MDMWTDGRLFLFFPTLLYIYIHTCVSKNYLCEKTILSVQSSTSIISYTYIYIYIYNNNNNNNNNNNIYIYVYIRTYKDEMREGIVGGLVLISNDYRV